MSSAAAEHHRESAVEIRRLTREHLDWVSELLARGLTVRVRATGRSMAPFVLSGEWIWLRASENAPCVGDIVMALEGGSRILVHRVVRIAERNGETWVQTRGDACPRDDQWMPLNCVVGRVVRVESFDASHVQATFRALVLGRLPLPARRFAWHTGRATGALIRNAAFALRS